MSGKSVFASRHLFRRRFFTEIFFEGPEKTSGRRAAPPRLFSHGRGKKKIFFLRKKRRGRWFPGRSAGFLVGRKGPGRAFSSRFRPGGGKSSRRVSPPGRCFFISPCAWPHARGPWWRRWRPSPAFRLRREFPRPCRAWPEWRRAFRAGVRGSSAGSA